MGVRRVAKRAFGALGNWTKNKKFLKCRLIDLFLAMTLYLPVGSNTHTVQQPGSLF